MNTYTDDVQGSQRASDSVQNVIPLANYKLDDSTASKKKRNTIIGVTAMFVIGICAFIPLMTKDKHGGGDKPGPDPSIQLNEMLANAPNSSIRALEMWQKQTALNFTFFDEHFKKAYNMTEHYQIANTSSLNAVEMWDNSNGAHVSFSEWEDGCLPGVQAKCSGMRFDTSTKNAATGNKHGVVRMEYSNGTIDEGSWYGLAPQELSEHGCVRHGARRVIDGELTFFQFWYFN